MSESVTSVATLIDQTTTPLASTPYKSPSCPNLGHVAPISEVVNQAAEEEDKSKWKAGLSILRKFIGAKELWRISIPASLLEPIPNLEYWHYLERPDYFAQINDYEDPLHRMLALVRWWVSKDIKHVHGKLIKPYNSVLGEQFLCRWQVAVPALDGHGGTKDFIDFKPDDQVSQPNNPSNSIAEEDEDDAVKDSETADEDDFHDAVDDDYNQSLESVLVRAVMEQISHHPPVSAFHYECPSRGIEARGVDQLAIGFTGTSVKINSGDWANGVFIKLKRPNPSLATTTTTTTYSSSSFEDEEYHITLPTAHVNGWLRGSLYVSLSDHCIISCPKTGYSCVLEYKEEKWLGKAKCEVEGKIYYQVPKPGASLEDYFFCSGNTADSEVDKQLKKKTRKEQVKKIFQNHQVVGDISGSWKGEIFYTLSDSNPKLLVDISKIRGIPKIVRPLNEQSPLESRNIWKELTEALIARDFTTASRAKLAVEDAQRKLANERKQKEEDFIPYYFEKEDVGKWKLKTSPSW